MERELPDSTQRLLRGAAEVARNAGSFTVEPVHLLFALAATGDNMVASVFVRHGLILKPQAAAAGSARQDLAREPALSERAAAVLAAAQRAAVRRGEIPVRVSHIALALMRSRNRWLREVLQANGVDAPAALRELLRELDGDGTAEERLPEGCNIALWSEEARRIVRAAPYEAAIFAHDYIGSEHLLLSLLRDAINPAAQFLERFYNLPISIAGVPSAVKANGGTGARMNRHRFEFTPNAEKIMLDSQIAASRMNRRFVGSEHIVAAIVMNPNSKAARALAKRVPFDRLEEDLRANFLSG